MIANSKEYKKIAFDAIKDYNNHNYQEALDKFKRMSEINYQNPKIHEILAYIYLKQNNINKAEEELSIVKNILNNRSSYSEVEELKNIDDLKFDQNEFIKLKKEYEEILKQPVSYNFNKELEIATKLSNIYMSVKEYKKAEKILEDYKTKFLPLKNKINER